MGIFYKTNKKTINFHNEILNWEQWTDLYPKQVRDDVRCTGRRLALLWDGQRSCLNLGLWKQSHLQLHCHLPRSRHLTHKLRRLEWQIANKFLDIHLTTQLRDGAEWSKPTGTSTPLCAASSHSQQAIAVSILCSVNIFRGDQQRWCKSRGSQSENIRLWI